MQDLQVKFLEALTLLEQEGVKEITVGSLAVHLSKHLPGTIQTGFHCIHRYGHKVEGWILTRNARHVQVLRRK